MINSSEKTNIVILISQGGGLMHTAIKESLKLNSRFCVKAVIGSGECAGLAIAKSYSIPTHIVDFNDKSVWVNASAELWTLMDTIKNVDYVFMLGWLMKLDIPENWSDKVLNMHPSLLPLFGGEGMYGSRVHSAVKKAGMQESGFTIHFADNNYDTGKILYQQKVLLLESDTVEDIQQKIIDSQHEYIGKFLNMLADEEG